MSSPDKLLPRLRNLHARPSPGSPIGLKLETRRLKEENKIIKKESITDSLTGLYNRRLFDVELNRISHSRHSFFLFIIDIDKFKTINDIYGHPEGDSVLIDSAKILTRSFRKDDIVCRIGGDEFGVLMIDEQDINNNEILKLKLSEIEENLLSINKERAINNLPIFTFTVGHATNSSSINNIYSIADIDLYNNKREKGIN